MDNQERIKEILENFKRAIHGSEYDYHCRTATLEEHNKYMENHLNFALQQLLELTNPAEETCGISTKDGSRTYGCPYCGRPIRKEFTNLKLLNYDEVIKIIHDLAEKYNIIIDCSAEIASEICNKFRKVENLRPLEEKEVERIILEILCSQDTRPFETKEYKAKYTASAICSHFSKPQIIYPEKKKLPEKLSALSPEAVFKRVGFNEAIDKMYTLNKKEK